MAAPFEVFCMVNMVVVEVEVISYRYREHETIFGVASGLEKRYSDLSLAIGSDLQHHNSRPVFRS